MWFVAGAAGASALGELLVLPSVRVKVALKGDLSMERSLDDRLASVAVHPREQKAQYAPTGGVKYSRSRTA